MSLNIHVHTCKKSDSHSTLENKLDTDWEHNDTLLGRFTLFTMVDINLTFHFHPYKIYI